MKTIGKIASIIIFNIIGFLFLFACRSHEHRLGDYLWDDHLHWQECLECHEKINYVYHTYGSWQIVEESTEEKEGVRKQTCSACGYFKEESIPPLSHIHQFGLWYFVDIPSKDKEGKIKRTCTLNDSHTQEMSLPRLNQTFYRYKIITDASCSQVGVASYSFIKDDQTLEIKVDIPMVDHTYAIDWSYDDKGHWHQATCEHSSLQKDYEEHTYKNGYCTTCNQKEDKDEHIHTFGKWELIDSPTFEQVGKLRHLCLTNDEHMEYKELPKLNSKDYLYEIKEESTCSQKGKAEYLYKIEEQEFIFLVELEYSDHPYLEEWSSNAKAHWHASNCIHNVKKDEAEHLFIDGKCSICGYIEYSQGLLYEMNEDQLSYRVIGVESFKDSELVIPSLYRGFPVTRIGNSAFANCDFLKKVRLAEGIIELEDSAFAGCSGLLSIELPATIKRIGNHCFMGCLSLETVSLQEGFEELGDSVFQDCTNLSSLSIPNSLMILGDSLVEGCPQYEFTYDKDAKYIGNESNPYFILYRMGNPLIENYTIHNKTRFISNLAFSTCQFLQHIEIPDSVVYIGRQCFYYCEQLEYIILGNEITYIDSTFYSYCDKFKTVFFKGTKEEFEQKQLSSIFSYMMIYYFSENPSLDTEWTWDENHLPMPFSKKEE